MNLLSCQKDLFNIDPDVTWLNNAFAAPMLHSVEAAANRGMRSKLAPWELTPDSFFDNAEAIRKAFGQIINATDTDRIALVPSVSYGLANVANNLQLKANDEVVVVGEQFPSNVYAWSRPVQEAGAKLVTVSAPTAENRGEAWNAALLEAITSATAAVAMANIHWADGTLFDLVAVRNRCDEVGALLIIDGTQSVGAMPFDLQQVRPDALVCAGYKSLMGIYGMGVAWYGPFMDNGTPIEENWINRSDSHEFAGLVAYRDSYRPGMQRFNMGELSSFIHTAALHEALNQINQWGPANIQQYCKEITASGVAELRSAGFRIEADDWRAHHLFGIRLPEGADMERIRARLAEAKVYVSMRGDAIRVSPHVYTTRADMARLVDCCVGVLA